MAGRICGEGEQARSRNETGLTRPTSFRKRQLGALFLVDEDFLHMDWGIGADLWGCGIFCIFAVVFFVRYSY